MYDSRGNYIERDDIEPIEPPFYCPSCDRRLTDTPNLPETKVMRYPTFPVEDENGNTVWIDGEPFEDWLPPAWSCECGALWEDPSELMERNE